MESSNRAGAIWVYSEHGKGTTFKIYLPRAEGIPGGAGKTEERSPAMGGSETILVVEDNPSVRSFVRDILEGKGYTLIEASGGYEALRMVQSHPEPIHLLLTDVVMPRMSGREMAAKLAPLHPEAKVLYISGYTDNAIVHHGVLDAGTYFLQKPFIPEALVRKVREVLDQ